MAAAVATSRLVLSSRLAARSQSTLRPVVSLASRSQPYRGLPGRSFSAQSSWRQKKYTEEHEWIELSPDGKTGTIGITNYASRALGDVVYVELPDVDLKVSKGDNIGAVESVKSASDIMTPISGKIIDTNDLLEEKPSTINKGPEAEGWLAKIEVDDATELDALMTKEQYDQHAEGEGEGEEGQKPK